MIRFFRAAIAAAAIVTASAAASAGDTGPGLLSRKVVVAFGDLDLSTADGRSALMARIDAAATSACGGRPSIVGTDLHTRQVRRAAFAECRTNARDGAFAHLERHGIRLGADTWQVIGAAPGVRR